MPRRGCLCAFAVVAATLAGGCARAAPDRRDSLVRDSAGIRIVTNLAATVAQPPDSCWVDPMPDISIGDAAGLPEYELHRVFGAAMLSDGKIAVLDQGSSQLRLYDSTGTFLAASGSEGDGPGEFRNAYGLWVLRGDTLWAGDYGAWQFEVFAPDGHWIRAVKPATYFPASPDIIVVLEDGVSIMGDFKSRWQGTSDYRPATIDLLVHDRDGALLDTLSTLDYGVWAVATPGFAFHRLFESFPMAAGSARHFVWGHGGRTELLALEAVAGELRLLSITRFEMPSRAVTTAAVADERRRVAEEYFELDGETAHIPTADVMPAFTGLLVEKDGRMWVREYRRGTDNDIDSWLTFSPEGFVECRLWLPKVRRVFAFANGTALVLHVDRLGVERVRRLRLHRAAR